MQGRRCLTAADAQLLKWVHNCQLAERERDDARALLRELYGLYTGSLRDRMENDARVMRRVRDELGIDQEAV